MLYGEKNKQNQDEHGDLLPDAYGKSSDRTDGGNAG